jgi:hypothetical protein
LAALNRLPGIQRLRQDVEDEMCKVTSGEYLGCFFIAPFSRTMEPLQNPGRSNLCARALNASSLTTPLGSRTPTG